MSKSKKVVLISFGALVAFCFLLLGIVCCAVGISRVENHAEAAVSDEGQLYNFNQLIQSRFESGSYNSSSSLIYTYSGYTFTLNGTLESGITQWKWLCSVPVKNGHKYAFKFSNILSSSTAHCVFNPGSFLDSQLRFLNDSFFVATCNVPDRTSSLLVSCSYTTFTNFTITLQMYDLTLLGLEDISTLEQWLSFFPSEYYDYTTGTLISTSFQSGYNLGYKTGFDDGLVSYVNGSSVFTCDSSNFVSPSPLWENVIGNYYTVNGRTDGPVPLFLNVGYLDIFQLNFSDILNSFPSFSWNLPTAAVVDGILTYSTNSYYSTYFGYDTGDYNILYFSDSTSSSDPWENYHVYMIMQDHSTEIYVDFFLSSSQSSSPVPNFNSSFGIDIYALSFSLTSQSSEFYSNGYNDGIDHANSTLNTTSVSYTTGYNRGFADAENPITFTNLMTSVLDVPLKTFNGLFNFDFLGINLKAFLLSLFTLGLIVAIIRLCLGGKS